MSGRAIVTLPCGFAVVNVNVCAAVLLNVSEEGGRLPSPVSTLYSHARRGEKRRGE